MAASVRVAEPGRCGDHGHAGRSRPDDPPGRQARRWRRRWLIVEDERKLRELARSYLGYRQRRLARVVAGLIVLVAVVAPVLQLLAHRPGALPVAMVLFGFSMASARFALRPAGAASAARRPPPRGSGDGAGRAVPLLNARSGCRKAVRLDLAALARQSGADVLPMRPGNDLGELARSTRLNFMVPAPGAGRVTGFCCTWRRRPRSPASCRMPARARRPDDEHGAAEPS